MVVPVDNQFLLFSKILTFERELRVRVGNEIVVGIIYQKKFRSSLNVKNDLEKAMTESPIKKINEIPIQCLAIDIGEEINLDTIISQNKVNVLYIAPVRAFDLKSIAALSRTRKILNFSGVADYIESGIAVCIGIKNEKPQIIINLPAIKAAGIEFSSQLLKLVKVIQ